MATATTAYLSPHAMHGLLPQSKSGTAQAYGQSRSASSSSANANGKSASPSAPTASSSRSSPVQTIKSATDGKSAQRKLAPAKNVALAPAKIATGARPLRPLIAAGPSKQTSTSASSKPVLAIQPARSNAAAKPLRPAIKPSASSSILDQRKASTSSNSTQGPDGDSASASTKQSPSTTAQSPTSSSSTTSAGGADNALETSTSTKKEDLQAKRDWVLPARAKPGRKPSDIEPPTKRKAQNRASQRAFRERRQSYLASLEAKIAEYEQKGAGVSQEIQRVARRLKDENAALRSENAKLKARIAELEAPASTPSRSAAQSPERVATRRSSLQSSTEVSGRDTGGDCGFCTREECVCIGEGVLDFHDDEDAVQNGTIPAPPAAPVQPVTSATPARTALPLKRTASGTHAKLWYTVPSPAPQQTTFTRPRLPSIVPSAPAQTAQHDVQVCPTVSRNRWSAFHPMARHLPPFAQPAGMSASGPSYRINAANRLPPISPSQAYTQSGHNGMSLSRPQVGTPRKTIWPVYAGAVRSQQLSTTARPIPHRSPLPSMAPQTAPRVFRMKRQSGQVDADGKALACSGDPDNCSACSTDPALAAFCKAVSAHLVEHSGPGAIHGPVILDTGNAVPLRRTRHAHSQSLESAHGYNNLPQSEYAYRQRKRPRSGTLTDGGPASSLYTNGNAHEGAASSRPRLWKIANDNGVVLQPANHAHGAFATGQISASSSAALARPHAPPLTRMPTVESIPDAWRRIKQHPSFDEWQGQQGGLDLLADVVARRESSSGGDEQASPALQPSETPRRRVRIAESGTRDVDDDASQAMDLSSPTSTDEPDRVREASSKRRRIYVERQSVDNVLAMMDQGRAGKTVTRSPSSESASATSPKAGPSRKDAAQDDGTACACPLSKLMSK